MKFRGVTLEAFAKFLATPTERPVIDRTGLSGLFDMDLEVTAELGPPPPPPGAADRVDRAFSPSMFTALRSSSAIMLYGVPRASVTTNRVGRLNRLTD